MRLLSLLLLSCCHDPALVKPSDSASTVSLDTAEPPEQVMAPSDLLYPPDRVIEVEIDLDPADWTTLAHQERNIMEMVKGDCLAAPWPAPYTWFPARVVVEGEEVALAGVRKKGLLGSASWTKPSLKLSFDEYEKGREIFGLDELTLNNARQDLSFVRQCMGYALFNAAGVPSPRCGFAHVRVNGEDLGIYVNVEPVDHSFLERHYVEPDGDLYEGRLSDFRDGWTGTFDKKTNEDDPDRGDLTALSEALEADDASLLAAIEPLVDLDAFITYWAMEVLLGHWDSYSGNTNNFFIYHDPATERFYFHPWGADAVLDSQTPFGQNALVSVAARAALPWRLYRLPETQDRYVQRLQALLDTVWDETRLLSDLDRMQALLDPYIPGGDHAEWSDALDLSREVIETRRDAIQAEWSGGPPPWTEELPGYPCMTEIGGVSGTFSTSWGDWDLLKTGEATLSFNYLGTDYPVTDFGVLAATDEEGVGYIAVSGNLEWSASILVYMILDPALLAPGSLPVDWTSVEAYLYYKEGAADWGLAAYIYGGTLDLQAAGPEVGNPLTGTFATDLWGSPE